MAIKNFKGGAKRMTFFDIDPQALPDGVEYFFNILVCVFEVPVQILQDAAEINGLALYSDLSHITDARPYITILAATDKEEISYQEIAHCVVEVCENDFAWYPMVEPSALPSNEDAWAFAEAQLPQINIQIVKEKGIIDKLIDWLNNKRKRKDNDQSKHN